MRTGDDIGGQILVTCANMHIPDDPAELRNGNARVMWHRQNGNQSVSKARAFTSCLSLLLGREIGFDQIEALRVGGTHERVPHVLGRMEAPIGGIAAEHRVPLTAKLHDGKNLLGHLTNPQSVGRIKRRWRR
ncbi:hypothetical protein [Agrobacterium rubi]|uniref:hypothetical protein n=1 Tax=Agrobacterium rubi TaxID=28099 RepID=UPI00201B7F41|nr:hypothetical protein [Agrobacterium rubi]